MATYPIRQLADNGGTAQFVPVTAPEAVQFPDGSNLNTLIGSIATIESNPVAANHAVGEFLCVNGQVYEVIDAIAAGDSIALGENVQVANLGSEITALNNGFITIEIILPTVTIPSNSNIYDQVYNLPDEAGYIPWAVGGFSLQGEGYASCGFSRVYVYQGGRQLQYAIFNAGSSSATLVMPKVRVIYKRSN